MAAPVALHNVTKRFDAESVAVTDLTLQVDAGEFVILVGPSGCGKTTALRMVAGLEDATSGEISIGDRVVNDVPAAARDVAMVFQNYALYPHMSVYDNLRFPLRLTKVRRQETATRVEHVARLLGLEDLLHRKPAQLSGGQRQRVAIGRALVRRPQAFLMDEPLSNLDAKLRVQMRAELIDLHQQIGVTTLYVTHDQTEAMTLGDRVVVMNKGVVQQIDEPERLYLRPANMFVAGFIGSPPMSFFHGVASAGMVDLGPVLVPVGRGISGPVIVGLRPEDFALASDPDDPALVADVQITEQLGPELLAYCSAAGLRIAEAELASTDEAELARSRSLRDRFVVRLGPTAGVRPGDRIRLSIAGARLRIFDPATGQALGLA